MRSGPRRLDALEERLGQLVLDERDGPAAPIGDEQALALVRRARAQAARSGRAPRARRIPRGSLVAAAVVVASSAAAAVGTFPQLLGLAAPKPPAVETPAAPAAPPAPRRLEAPRAPAPAAAELVTPPAPPASPAPARRAPERPRVAPPRAPDSAPAADLLLVASRARAERRFELARQTYRRVIERFPGTRQAQIARVSAADLELERGDARAAEALYRVAAQDPEIGAEALFGLAEAYRALGRGADERRALALFQQRHPDNPLVRAARERLTELDGTSSESKGGADARP
jgi:hypothetical protein